jgi:hypothetical protein
LNTAVGTDTITWNDTMRHNNSKRTIITLAVALLAGWAAPRARAGVLYIQPYDGMSPGFNSQVYTDGYGGPFSYSTQAFDDVTVPTGQVWNITQVTILGQEQGNASANVSVNLQFQNAPPKFGSSAKTYTGTEIVGPPDSSGFNTGNLVFTTPITLTPGTYWITGWVVRPEALPLNAPGGQWFWYETNMNNPIGSEFYYQNPGGGYFVYDGLGVAPGTQLQPGSNYNGYTADLAFEIDGFVTPEPSSWCLFGLGGFGLVMAGVRKRMNSLVRRQLQMQVSS